MRRTLAALALTLALPGPALLVPPARAQAVVVVREGDTLSDIAERYGVGLTRLMQANGISDPDLVVTGQRLTIPGGGVGSGVSSGGSSARGGSVTVQAGDTLSDIAARHGVSVTRLMQANGITDPDLVVAGQRLTLPGSGGRSAAPASRSSQPTAPYTVKSGETLSDIATRFNTSTERLIQLNALRNPDLVMSGTRLQVPMAPKRQTPRTAPAPARPSAPDRNARQHVVESGESLSVIAGRYGTTVEQLVALNRIEDPDRLLAGTRLQLRGTPPAPAARPVASPQQAAQPAPRPAPQPTPQPQAQPQGQSQPQAQSQPQPQAQPQPQPQPQVQPQPKAQPQTQTQARTEPAAAPLSQPAAVTPTRESMPTPSRSEPVPASASTISTARAAATPAASPAATPEPRTRPQPPVQTTQVQPASVRTTASSPSRIAAATQGVPPTQAGTAPTARSTTSTASTTATTAATSTAASTAKRTPSAAAVTTGTATAAKGAATGATTIAARSTSRAPATSGDWRSYGPLQIDWGKWQSMGGSYVAPSLNSDGKARYLAVNCTARKLNTTTPAGQWNSWESPGQDFEKKLVQDICKEKGS